jgi:hypothetical protein
MNQSPGLGGGAIAEVPGIGQPVSVRVARARGIEGHGKAAREGGDVRDRHRPVVGLPNPGRQHDANRLACVVPDLEGDVVRQLVTAGDHDGRIPAALVLEQRHLPLAPLVLPGRRERERAERGREREVGIGRIEIAHDQSVRAFRRLEAQLRDPALVRHADRGRVGEDLEPVRREVAPIAQTQDGREQVAVVAACSLDQQTENPLPVHELALLGRYGCERLPSPIGRRAGTVAALRQQLADLELRLAVRPGRFAEGALTAKQRVDGLRVLAFAIDEVVIATGVRVEHAQVKPIGQLGGDGKEDHLAIVVIALLGPCARAVGDRERFLLRPGLIAEPAR